MKNKKQGINADVVFWDDLKNLTLGTEQLKKFKKAISPEEFRKAALNEPDPMSKPKKDSH
jgi:hypothetical protein